jgi:hypothetical protein
MTEDSDPQTFPQDVQPAVAPSVADSDSPISSPEEPGQPASPTDLSTWAQYIANVYAVIVRPLGTRTPVRMAAYRAHAMALLQELAPRDAIEQLLAGQLVLLQARIQYLSAASVIQQGVVWSQLYSTQLERASDAFQKVQQSLLEHRRPRRRRRGGSFTTIRTAHITAQQLIGIPVPAQVSHAIENKPQFTEADRPRAKKIQAKIDPET